MRYLKTYNEKVGVRLNSELKSTIEDLLIDLRDEEFETKVSEIDYERRELVKVIVEKDTEFTYDDIKLQIESVWSYLKSEGFKIEQFTCVEDWNDLELPENEFTIHQKSKGYHWHTVDGKIKSIEKDFQRKPVINKEESFNSDLQRYFFRWSFHIFFTKDKFVVDKTRGHLSTNEELKPQTYISAADKLSKLGHIKRPEQLKAWAETIKQRETDAKHKMCLQEAKKLGQFQLRFTRGGEIKFANFYIQLGFNSDYYLHEQLPEWFGGNSDKLWSEFMFGVHPVSQEDLEVLDWYAGGEIRHYINKYNGIIWLQNVYINLTTQNHKEDIEGGEKLPMTPSGVISIEGSDFNEVYFANRQEAIKFRNLLVNLLEGNIEYFQYNGKNFLEEIIDSFFHNDIRSLSVDEFSDFIDKIKKTRLNSLYRD